jgi:hypothetical protein
MMTRRTVGGEVMKAAINVESWNVIYYYFMIFHKCTSLIIVFLEYRIS